MEKYGGQKDYWAEAQYYLEVTNFDLALAMDEFEADLKFEQETEAKGGVGKGKVAAKKKK